MTRNNPPLKINPIEESGFPRLENIVPDGTRQAVSLHISQIQSARLRELELKMHAGLVDQAEQATQNVFEHQKIIEIGNNQASNEYVDMRASEEFADTNAGARGYVKNFKRIFLTYDPPTIADFLISVNPPDVTKAARTYMERSRIQEIINALTEAMESW